MNYKFFFPRLLVDSLLLVFFASFAFGAKRLSQDEVKALRDIGKALGKAWNFSVDPCSGELGWATYIPPPVGQYMNNVTCDNCSSASSTTADQICHVTNILLKGQNLTGQLPLELIRLPYLQEIDLTRNYLSGKIPPQWGSLPLVNISLVNNRLTGSIPLELGNITTLKTLAIDFNRFTGVLPAELGNLSSIEQIRIGDSSFSGKLPNFIQSWTNLETLVIQASGFTGPIPSGISLLTKLTELRIIELNEFASYFPPLQNMKSLQRLILRNSNIRGQLPAFLGDMTNLKILDLSFNKLTEEIPDYWFGRTNLDYL